MQNVVVLQQIWLYEIIGGALPMCQKTTLRVNGSWSKKYCVLCSKTYNTLHSCHNFPAGLGQAARGASICEIYLTDDSASDKQEAKTKANTDSCKVNSVLFYLSQNLVIGGRTYAATDSKYVKLIESQQSL